MLTRDKIEAIADAIIEAVITGVDAAYESSRNIAYYDYANRIAEERAKESFRRRLDSILSDEPKDDNSEDEEEEQEQEPSGQDEGLGFAKRLQDGYSKGRGRGRARSVDSSEESVDK